MPGIPYKQVGLAGRPQSPPPASRSSQLDESYASMASGELSKAIERCLRRTEALCEKYCRDRALPPEEISARATVAFNDSIEALCKIWRRWDATVAAVSIPAKADLCKVWLGAFIETKAISRLLALLEGMAEQGAVATSSTSSVTAR